MDDGCGARGRCGDATAVTDAGEGGSAGSLDDSGSTPTGPGPPDAMVHVVVDEAPMHGWQECRTTNNRASGSAACT